MREDAAYLLDFEESAMRHHAEALWGGWRASATVENYDTTNHRIVMASQNAVGCVAVARRPNQPFVRKLYIAPTHRNGGIGSAVIRSKIVCAERLGLPVRLSVLSTNTALRFYAREGFVSESENAERRNLRRGADLNRTDPERDLA